MSLEEQFKYWAKTWKPSPGLCTFLCTAVSAGSLQVTVYALYVAPGFRILSKRIMYVLYVIPAMHALCVAWFDSS